ncbi:MAG TPA: hydroxysqualene dehydroxylase HpnE [Methylophilus sp.]
MANPAASRRHIAVVGAGLSGLAAAMYLLRHGHQVSLFEAAPQAGGRARSVALPATMIDNGQHLCIGAYHQTLQLLQQAGLTPAQCFHRWPLALHMYDGAHRMSLITSRWLPAPLHLLSGLLMAQGLSWRSKWQALRWMMTLKRQRFTLPADCTLLVLLKQQQQTSETIRYLWEPLCLAALNTPIQYASAQVFLHVLRDSFQHKQTDSDFLVAKSDLSETMIQPLLAQIQALGGQLFLREPVTALMGDAAGCQLVTARQTSWFDDVIVAVAPHQLKTITGDFQPPLSFAYEPITTIYLQFAAETRLPQPIIGLCHGLAQWAFDRGQCCDQAGLIAIVISAHARLPADKALLVQQCIAELNLALASDGMQLPQAPLWYQVITEKRATFHCAAGLERPRCETRQPHILLAGDYVSGPYPATIEGAVRSGQQAAQRLCD